MIKRLLLAPLALAVLLFNTHVHAQALDAPPPPLPTDTELELARIDNVAELMGRARQYYEDKDWRRYTYVLERLTRIRPYNGGFQFKLAQAYAMQDMKTPAYDLLLKMQQQGLSYDPSTVPEAFEPVSSTQVYSYIVDALQRNAAPFGEGSVAMTLGGDVELIESLAWDAGRGQLLVGSGRTGEVFRVGKDGNLERLAAPQPDAPWWGVLALTADSERDALWLATTALPHFPGTTRETLGISAILKLRLSDGKLLEHHLLPVDGRPHVIGALTTAAGGNLYALDSVSNVVYRIRDGQIEQLLSLPSATSLRGIAVNPNEQLLYLSDYELGMLIADVQQQQVVSAEVASHNLGGIEHLSWHDGYLIAIQNYNQPNRVMRMLLSPDGRSLKSMAPLESSKPAMQRPTVGVVGGDRFYFIANSQRDDYGPDGRLFDGLQAEPRVIYQVSPSFALKAQQESGGPKAAEGNSGG